MAGPTKRNTSSAGKSDFKTYTDSEGGAKTVYRKGTNKDKGSRASATGESFKSISETNKKHNYSKSENDKWLADTHTRWKKQDSEFMKHTTKGKK